MKTKINFTLLGISLTLLFLLVIHSPPMNNILGIGYLGASQKCIDYMEKGDYENALYYANRAIADSNVSGGFNLRAEVYALRGDFGNAIADLSQETHRYSEFTMPPVLLEQACLYEYIGESFHAAELYSLAIEMETEFGSYEEAFSHICMGRNLCVAEYELDSQDKKHRLEPWKASDMKTFLQNSLANSPEMQRIQDCLNGL